MSNHPQQIKQQAILELTVDNHPGVMSHVCGLFSRRAFNVDGILCLPMNNRNTSQIWLRVQEGDRLSQVESQLMKLHDVHSVRRHSPDHAVFDHLEGFFTEKPKLLFSPGKMLSELVFKFRGLWLTINPVSR